MERRYLIATLALIATFAVFSRGLRSLQRYSQLPNHRVEVTVGLTCPSDSSRVSRWVAKARSHLRPALPEEAQLLAELNVPVEALQVRVNEQAERQGEAAARCAREIAARETERAQREAERAQRQAMKIQEKMVHVDVNAPIEPISFNLNLRDRIERRVQVRTAVLATRMSAASARLQAAADRLQAVSGQMAASGLENADFETDEPQVAVQTRARVSCQVQTVRTVRTERSQTRQVTRPDSDGNLRPGEYAF